MAEKLALVTGSTSGIGREIALRLAGSGYDVVVNGFGAPAEIEQVVKECKEKGARKVEYHGADLSDVKQIVQMFEFVREKFGRGPDVLVNNAGIQHVAPLEDYPVHMWDKMVAINLTAPFHTTRLAIKEMKERGWGRIVNIASDLGLSGAINKVPYVATKHGVVGMTKAVALEVAGSGVTCNAICPGFVLTPLVKPQVEAIMKRDGVTYEEAKTKLLSGQPTGEFVMPSEVAALVAMLCGDEAKQITGSSLVIDGGGLAQ
ncbi:hypothetical protein EMCRGX_G004301 [Ephydatia muelleri]